MAKFEVSHSSCLLFKNRSMHILTQFHLNSITPHSLRQCRHCPERPLRVKHLLHFPQWSAVTHCTGHVLGPHSVQPSSFLEWDLQTKPSSSLVISDCLLPAEYRPVTVDWACSALLLVRLFRNNQIHQNSSSRWTIKLPAGNEGKKTNLHTQLCCDRMGFGFYCFLYISRDTNYFQWKPSLKL